MPKPCPCCGGSGKHGDMICDRCNGTGHVPCDSAPITPWFPSPRRRPPWYISRCPCEY